MGGIQVQSDDALSSARITYENGGSNSTVTIPKDGGKLSVGTHLSGLTPYHLLEGSVQVLNTTSSAGVSNVLYTGTGSVLDVVTGMDMDSQWGNLSSERFGGMTLIKGNNASVTSMVDSIRGVTSTLLWNSPSISASQVINSFSPTGFQVVGSNSNVNTSGVVYQSLSFGTNRRRSGVTNHGMSFTEHYNMESGFTILSWFGSGKDRHEIPHMLGRKFDFYMIKNLTNGTVSYQANYEGQYKNFYLANNTIDNEKNVEIIDVWSTDNLLNVSNTDRINYSGQQYICYGWCSAIVTASKEILGNYEIIKYNGNDYRYGSLLKTKAKPLALIYKAITANSEWILISNKNGLNNYQTLSNSGLTLQTMGDSFKFTNDGIIFPWVNWSNNNGTDYIMIIVYDNDNTSGKSLYNRSNDSSTLNLVNAKIPFAQGLDSSGSTKISTLNRNELVSGVALFPGKNYLAMNNSGVYSNTTYNPNYNVYSGFGDYYESNRNKWYKNVSIVSDNFTSDTLANYTAENASLSIINGKLKVQNTGTTLVGKAKKTFTTVVGKRYAVVYDYNSTVPYSGVNIGATDGGQELLAIKSSSLYNDKGIKYFTATSTTSYLSITTANVTSASTVHDHIAIYPVNNDNTVDLSNATEILDSRNYLNSIVYADHNSQPVMVENIYKTVYNKDITLTGIVDFKKVEKVDNDGDYNFNINGKKKLTITENNGILNQDGKALSTGGVKNILINGGFDIWQRGTNITGSNASGFTWKWAADRWYAGYDNIGANTTVYPSMEDVYEGRRTQAIAIMTNAIGSNVYVDLATHLEDMLKFAGRTFTLSFLCVSDSISPLRLYVGRYYSATAGLTYSQSYLFGNGQPNGMKKYSVTFRVPDYNGEVYDKNSSFLKILIRHDRNTNGVFRIAEAQLEEGTVATSFEHRPYAMELSMCQRYYEKGEVKIFTGLNASPAGVATFKVTKRKAPSITTDTSYQGIKRFSNIEWINTEAFSAAGVTNNGVGELIFSYTADAELITL